MSANEVAMALKNQELCSSSIADNACISSELISPEEWKGVEAMKQSVIHWGRDNLCNADCQDADQCGPIYLYITQFNVLPGGQDKDDFAESFSLDLLNALNAGKDGECDASLVFFFSRADRLIAIGAPQNSYLYPHVGEIYLSVRGYFTQAMDSEHYSFAQAANSTLVDIYHCLIQEEGMCVSEGKKGGVKWKSGYTVIIVVGVCLILFGLFVCWLCCCVKQDGRGGPSFNMPAFSDFVDFDDDD